MAVKTILLTLVGASALGAASICNLCETPAATAAQVASAAELDTVRLKIEGMTCGGCAVAARKIIARLAGVTKAEVSYETKQAVVTYDPARVTIEQIIAAVRKLGYRAEVITENIPGWSLPGTIGGLLRVNLPADNVLTGETDCRQLTA
ncbi:MAG: metal-binding (seleno)protein [Gemmatimonadota bacterium]